MKKLYIQPATELVCTATYAVMQSISLGFGGSGGGMGGDAPLRNFDGSTQGLKYLI